MHINLHQNLSGLTKKKYYILCTSFKFVQKIQENELPELAFQVDIGAFQ